MDDAKEREAMNVAISARWEKFVEELVRSGRYASPAEVMKLGLSFVEEREAQQEALRETIAASLPEGGDHSIIAARARVEDKHRELEAKGR
jgi:antitoxin ParD1/3/4